MRCPLRILFFAGSLGILAVPAVCGAENTPRPPVLDGGFWQVGPELLDQFTDEQFAREIANMRELGMDLLIIQYSALPRWPEDRTTQTAYVENSVYPVHPAFQERQPFDAIFRAAEEHGMKVILGGISMPIPYEVEYEQGVRAWISEDAMQYRRELIERFSKYESFHGWYTPNEPSPSGLAASGADPELLREATDKVTRFVKSHKPDLLVVKCIGLYLQSDGRGGHRYATRQHLDDFWRPWVASLDHVDVWMVIDGVGTGLSSLSHTDMAQRWARELADEFGKEFWVDVENAHMGQRYESFTMDELAASLEVAARHGTTLVTFDYIHYMSQQSPRPHARQLHADYREYLTQFVVRNEPPPSTHRSAEGRSDSGVVR